jgi:PBP1b-binding outer membrane lipoprotein LpoB
VKKSNFFYPNIQITLNPNKMKKVLFIAILAMCMVGCCKKADNKCCEGEKTECCQKAEEAAEAPAETPAEAPAEEAAPAEAPAEEAAPATAE